MSTTKSTPTRSQAGRTLDTCINLVSYFINRAIDINQHYVLDDVALTEKFNWWQNSTARSKALRDTSRDWTADEVIVLLVEVLQRGKVDLAVIRGERGAPGVGYWRAVDSAASLALGLDTLREREDRRVAMRNYAEFVEQERRGEAIMREDMRARRPMPYRRPPPLVLRPPPGRRAKNGQEKRWKMEVTRGPAGVVKSKGKPRAKSVVLTRHGEAKEKGTELLMRGVEHPFFDGEKQGL